ARSVQYVDALGRTCAGTCLCKLSQVLGNLRLALFTARLIEHMIALAYVRKEVVSHFEKGWSFLFAQSAVLTFRLINPNAHPEDHPLASLSWQQSGRFLFHLVLPNDAAVSVR